MKSSTKALCLHGLFTALVTLCTMSLQIPVPATNGYIHLGDSIILIAGVFYGWKFGMVAGGVGSMLADVLTGYSHWAPFTLIIKGLMGFAAGKIGTKDFMNVRNVAAALVTETIMIAGYLVGGAILKGSFAASIQSVPSNVVQAVGGIIIFAVVGAAFYKANITQYTKM